MAERSITFELGHAPREVLEGYIRSHKVGLEGAARSAVEAYGRAAEHQRQIALLEAQLKQGELMPQSWRETHGWE